MSKDKINTKLLFSKFKEKLLSHLYMKESEYSEVIDSDSLFAKFEKNVLSYLYMLDGEFEEVNLLINELKNYSPFQIDIANSTPTQNALNIAVVISYARSFKRSYGFYNTKEINTLLIKKFSKKEKELHDRVLGDRDKEFAHSDASAIDIQIYSEGDYSFSKRRLRQPLEKDELQILQEMVSIIRNEIDNQIRYLK